MESPDRIARDQTGSRLNEDDYRALLEQFVREDASLMMLLGALQKIDLPDWRLVSGAIYQTVWNRLTGKPQGHGIKDYDIAYFDKSDLSYEAEDAVIKRVNDALPSWADRIEIRNQARVHLWYPRRFGGAYPELACTDESLENYMCSTHAVAVRLEKDDSLSIAAPYGVADIFTLTLRPLHKFPTNQGNYVEKARRMVRFWPELRTLDWETGKPVRPELL